MRHTLHHPKPVVELGSCSWEVDRDESQAVASETQ